MSILAFASGNRTYQVNEKVCITFNPAAQQFAHSLMDMMDTCTKAAQEADTAKKRVEKDRKAVYEISVELDKKISEEIDALFGTGVAAALFPWGPATAWGDGLPEWVNFCLAVMDEILTDTETQHSQTDPRLEKYMEKYKRYERK